jgi:hypothetical protein
VPPMMMMMMMITMMMIMTAQDVFGYAGGHRFESSRDQLFFSATRRPDSHRGPEILLNTTTGMLR